VRRISNPPWIKLQYRIK